jgi:hypothetical protein
MGSRTRDSASSTPRRKLSVFINCPFDPDFRSVFDAIIFSTVCCGFLPRCAIESGSSALPRIDRILNTMFSSKYSIHDLSRCRGEGEANLARFNMPLELGIAMAQQYVAKGKREAHDWLVLVPRGHLYKGFVSDLAGFDPTEYDGCVETVVPAVMAWLATRPNAVRTAKPQSVLKALPVFQQGRDGLCREWRDQVPWRELLQTAIRIGCNHGLIPWSPLGARSRKPGW